MTATLTKRSRLLLAEAGYTVEAVRRGVLLAHRSEPEETVLVRACMEEDAPRMVRSIADAEDTPALRMQNWSLVVHAWRKEGGRWICREVDCS